MSEPARYRPLGAFRFALAVLVVLQHFQHLLPAAGRVVFSRMGFGATAVCVFFAVSGFVVAEANAAFYAGRPGAFLVNRALRVGPPYFAAFLLSLLVQSGLYGAGHLVLWDYTLVGAPWAPWRLLSGVLALLPGFNPRWLGQDFEFLPFVWSLRMEAAFYLAAALVLVAARRFGGWVIAAGFCAGLLASGVFLLGGRPGALSTAPMFLFGVALYFWRARPGVASVAAVGAALAMARWGFASWHQHGAPVLGAQLGVLAGLLGVFAWLAGAGISARFKRVDRAAGDLSYALYLNHYAVGLLLTGLFAARGLGIYAVGVVASVTVAWGMARAVEAPLRRVRDRVRERVL